MEQKNIRNAIFTYRNLNSKFFKFQLEELRIVLVASGSTFGLDI
jgi:hypothetical protein